MTGKTSKAILFFNLFLFLFALFHGAFITVIGVLGYCSNSFGQALSITLIVFGALLIAGFGINYIGVSRNDLLAGTYQLDKKGIKLTCPSREVFFSYKDCSEVGIVEVRANGRSGLDLYYIYFSKRSLTETQKEELLRVHRYKKFKRIIEREQLPRFETDYVMMQYDPGVFDEVVKYIPEEYRSGLCEQEKKVRLAGFLEYLHCGKRQKVRTNPEVIRDVPVYETDAEGILQESIEGRHLEFSKKDSFRASRITYVPFYILVLAFGIPSILSTIDYTNNLYSTYDWCLAIACDIFALYGAYKSIRDILTQPLINRVSFNKEGVVFKLPTKTLGIRFEDCKQIRLIKWQGRMPGNRSYFVCLSKVIMPEKNEWDLYTRSARKAQIKGLPEYKKDYFLFEYYEDPYDGPVIFNTLLKCVPERFKAKLLEDEKSLDLPETNRGLDDR